MLGLLLQRAASGIRAATGWVPAAYSFALPAVAGVVSNVSLRFAIPEKPGVEGPKVLTTALASLLHGVIVVNGGIRV